jgi:hypothetical protein
LSRRGEERRPIVLAFFHHRTATNKFSVSSMAAAREETWMRGLLPGLARGDHQPRTDLIGYVRIWRSGWALEVTSEVVDPVILLIPYID